MKKNSKLEFVQEFDGGWRIIYPEKMKNNYDRFYNALELLESEPIKGKVELENLIKENPNEHIDAYIHLGYYYQENLIISLYKKLIKKAYHISKSIIPKGFNYTHNKISWGINDNRALMRAFQAMGILLMEEGKFNSAIEKFKFLINVNPNDNQGIRFLLSECYFWLEKYNCIIKLFKDLPDDCTPEHYYGLGLIYYMKGNFIKAKDYLAKGIEHFPNVARDLVSNKSIYPEKEYSESYFGILLGGDVQAYEFREVYRKSWLNTKGALDFLLNLIPPN